MNLPDKKPDHTTIVVNTFPKVHLHKRFTPQHGCSPVFAKHNKRNVFQFQIFFRVLDADTREIIYEFRTSSNYFVDYDIKDKDFFPQMLDFIYQAIPDFNWYIKNNDSYLTLNKFYTQKHTLENIVKPITSAYTMAKLNLTPKARN